MFPIQKAKSEDAEAILEIRKEALLSQCASHYPMDILEPWANLKPTEEFRKSVRENFYLVLVEGQVAGTGMIDLVTGKIDSIFVHPHHIQKGIGKRILGFLEELALEKGLQTLYLESTLNAADFYRGYGFAGNDIQTYTTAKGISLECIPMTKRIGQPIQDHIDPTEV